MGVDELGSVGKRSEFRLFYLNASEFLIDSRKSLQLVSRCFVAVASSLRGRRSQSPQNRFGDVFFFVQRELFPLPLLSFTLPHIPLSFAYTSEDLVKRSRTINPQA